ncbi:MAG: hypothetical protein J6B67_01660 [Oscillospiraceae bacterium]|nr:hypothetical protein [Oscillospiraceae bacterium]
MKKCKIIGLILAVTAACALCACGNAQGQSKLTADDYLKTYLAENRFTMEENGIKTEYVDHEATQKLFEMYTAEGNSEMLQRFTKVDDTLLKMEKTVPTGIETTYCHYDAQGVLQKIYSSTDLSSFFTCHYDEDGRLVEKRLFRTGAAEPEAVCTYKYNKNGHCTRYQDEKGKVSTFKYTYDDNGAVLTGPRVEFTPEGSLISDTIRYTYEYDMEGRVSRMLGQQTNGKDISYEFVYDSQGRVVNVTNVMPEGNVTEVYSYEGDRLTERTETLKDGTTVQTYIYGTRYIFNAEGLQ